MSGKKLLAFNLLGGLAIWWLAGQQPSAPSGPLSVVVDPSHPPRLEATPGELTLGPTRPNVTARGTLTIRNTGSGPLHFKVETSCFCLVADQPVESLAPGAACQVELHFTIPTVGTEHKEVILLSNDPSEPYRRLPATLVIAP